ncbi:TonB-dependent receptor plug domain-containing protein [Tsuneonella suprasediminis]|uniref:TonB-dependent receptor plug domain-containing protein n=1 Tax=Tsuneonella suprasediminis TaxID=2306996 RepID=UPI002F944505
MGVQNDAGSVRVIPGLVAALSVWIAVPAPALAEEASGDSSPPIIVTGKGLSDTPATPAYDTRRIEREVLATTASGRIEDALASLAGFQQFRRSDSRSANPSAQGATLRALGGNASSRALILLDGVSMGDPFFGYIPFSAIVPERLAYVQVTRGGGSGPFGAGALAGTIDMVSADAASLGPVSGQVLVNDRGETEAGVTLAAPLGAGFATVSGRWDRGQGFWTTPERQRVPASARAAYDSYSVQMRAVAPLSDNIELQAHALAYRDDRTLRFAGADSSMEGQDASLRLVGRGDWQFDILGYVQARNFTNVVISSTRFVPVLDQRNTPATGLGGKIELRPPLGPANVLRIGLDYRKASGELSETALSAFTGQITARRHAGGSNTDLGLYLENDLTLGDLTLTAGVRADRFTIRDGFYVERDGGGALTVSDRFANRSGWDTSVRGGALYRLGHGVRMRAAAYTGLRLPTLNELYRPFVVFPVTTLANAALDNERLVGYEAGIDFAPGGAVDLSLTAFDNRVKHAIANVTLDVVTRQRRNIDAIHARGLEVGAGLSLGRFSLHGSLAYTDARMEQAGAAFDGNRPQQVPQWAGSATATYRPATGWIVATTLRHVGAQYEDDLQTDLLPAATIVDAYLQVPLTARLALVIRGENLSNEAIVTRNQAGSIDIGTPRTIWAGVKIGL